LHRNRFAKERDVLEVMAWHHEHEVPIIGGGDCFLDSIEVA
jgi:hypothetical protein